MKTIRAQSPDATIGNGSQPLYQTIWQYRGDVSVIISSTIAVLSSLAVDKVLGFDTYFICLCSFHILSCVNCTCSCANKEYIHNTICMQMPTSARELWHRVHQLTDDTYVVLLLVHLVYCRGKGTSLEQCVTVALCDNVVLMPAASGWVVQHAK